MDILLVEDEFDVAQNLVEYFERYEHSVEWAPDGLIGLESATRCPWDVIILDIALPRLSGIALCQRLRQLGLSDVPIMMLTAKGDLSDKKAAFAAGADDYVVKPFALEEIQMRIDALRRRHSTDAANAVLTVADLSFDVAAHEVSRSGHALSITHTGRIILEALMRNTHRVLSRDEIETLVWGEDPPRSDSLKIHVHALREAIDRPFPKNLLHTVRGVGYRLCDSDADA